MNERIKTLAEQAGLITFKFGEQGGYTTIEAVTDLNNLKRFADLVRQEEREACAKLCDHVAKEIDDTNGLATYLSKGIRGRTE